MRSSVCRVSVSPFLPAASSVFAKEPDWPKPAVGFVPSGLSSSSLLSSSYSSHKGASSALFHPDKSALPVRSLSNQSFASSNPALLWYGSYPPSETSKNAVSRKTSWNMQKIQLIFPVSCTAKGGRIRSLKTPPLSLSIRLFNCFCKTSPVTFELSFPDVSVRINCLV